MENILIYATLSAIKERKGNINSILEIYQDLVETAIKQHFNMIGKRGYIRELQETINKEYHLDMPLPTLELILKRINKSYVGAFHIYSDHSFDFEDISFNDITSTIMEQKIKIDKLNKLFLATKEKLNIKNNINLNDIIEKNKNNLLAYFNNRPFDTDIKNEDFNLLISFLRIPEHKILIENLFLGSLISCFTLLDPERITDIKIMLLDTNFIISLMDLHSSESYDTCKQILTIGHKLRYDFCILPETIIEIKNLLRRKSESITEIPIFAAQDRQTIEFGCYRKSITGNELLEYAKFVESFIRKNEIRVVDISVNDRLKKNIFRSEIYEKISNRPRNKIGAIHDAMAMEFVKENRTNEEELFSDTSSFFVTDSHGYIEKKVNLSTRLPLVIRAEELVTLLWLVFPYHDTDLIKSEISKIFSMYLNKRLPDKELLLSIDRKNRAFKNIGIRAKDCIKLAFNISEIERSQIEDLLLIKEEDDYFKEFGRLAHIASENKENHENQLREYTEAAIDLTWEENNKEMIQENELLKKSTLEKEKENEKLRTLKENDEIKILIDTQKEIIGQMEERIKELSAPIKLVEILLKVTLIIIPIVSIIAVGIKFIIPNWHNISPHIFIIQLVFPLLVILSEIFGLTRNLNYVRLSRLITNLTFKKRIKKIISLKNELEQKNKHLSDLRERKNNIIY